MTETLLDYLFSRLDQIKNPIFRHRELERFPENELRTRLTEGILRETSKATEIPRPKHLPPGDGLIVRQTRRGLFGVADEDDYFDPIPLGEDDVRQYDVSLSRLVALIRRKNEINGSGFQNHDGLVSLGQKALDEFGALDVYLSIPNANEKEFLSRCRRFGRSHGIDRVVVTPRVMALSPEGQEILEQSGIVTGALSTRLAPYAFRVDWPRLKRKIVSLGTPSLNHGIRGALELQSEARPDTATTEEGTLVLERKEVGGRVHWFVNGVDKGALFVRPESHIARITEILYNQVGHGWVPHLTFMNACAWRKEEYFSSSEGPGRMQRQLNRIRSFLGVDIEFRKDKGVRFAENTVKSK